MILTAKQEEGLKIALERYRNHQKYVTISGYAGTGKAQPAHTLVPTPEGFTRLGFLRVGDYVFDRNGKPTKILGVYPQGEKAVYEVVLADGRKSKCADDHLWTVYDKNNNLITLSTKELYEKENIKDYSLPMNKSVQYPGRQNIDFYEIGKRIISRKRDTSFFLQYRYSSKEERYAFLQGIMDNKGIVKDCKVYFCTTNAAILKCVRELLWSLGIKNIYSIQDSCYLVEIKVSNKDKHKLFRNSPYKEICDTLKDVEEIEDNLDKINIKSIVKTSGKEEMLCIYVDNPEHLYLTNDYIVTHNTTLSRVIINALDIDPKEVAYATYTGKASEVLRKNGCNNACTLHKLLYKSYQKADGSFEFSHKHYESFGYRVVLVDEVSMVPRSMINLLLHIPDLFCIFMGDPFQLPPISKNDSNNLLDKPHVFLSEIMRQAKESDIIQVSMKIRERQTLFPYAGNDINIVSQRDACTGMYDWADEILCATNNTRFAINKYMKRSEDMYPRIGDKIICQKNAWDILSDRDNPIINGTIGTITNIEPDELEYWIRDLNVKRKSKKHPFPYYKGKAKIFRLSLKTEIGDTYTDLPIDSNFLLNNEKAFTPQQEYYITHETHKGDYLNQIPLPLEASFGWAITTHRAQGSQWEKVTVIEENFPFAREEHARWLYTAITRAQKKCTLILK